MLESRPERVKKTHSNARLDFFGGVLRGDNRSHVLGTVLLFCECTSKMGSNIPFPEEFCIIPGTSEENKQAIDR